MVCLSGASPDIKIEFYLKWITDSVLSLQNGFIPIACLVYGLPQLLKTILSMNCNIVTASNVYLINAKAFVMGFKISYAGRLLTPSLF